MNDPSTDHHTITIPFLETATGGESIVGLRHVVSGKLYPFLSGATRLAIGSGTDCDIRLADPYISQAHCLLERPNRFRLSVTDTGSKNGVYVGGLRVRSAELKLGVELRLGRSAFTLVSDRLMKDGNAEDQLIGASPAFRAAIALAKRVARGGGDCSVLILGETGTGKELVARLIHENSARSSGPFVTLNCGGLTSTLIASELFGHIRGAYTGAGVDRPGLFVQADRGTLFLDEVGELPSDQQPHLLRALESGEVRPLGGNESKNVSVRFLAATNRLDLAVRQRIRSDLYHRLATIIIRLPPLRERLGDVPRLISAFMRREEGRERAISVETMRALQAYPWRGNVRELRHAVTRALTLSSGELTLRAFLPELEGELPEPTLPGAARESQTAYDDGVKQVLQAALVEYGSVRRAAKALGMPKSTFADRAKRLGLQGG